MLFVGGHARRDEWTDTIFVRLSLSRRPRMSQVRQKEPGDCSWNFIAGSLVFPEGGHRNVIRTLFVCPVIVPGIVIRIQGCEHNYRVDSKRNDAFGQSNGRHSVEAAALS